MNPDKVPSSFYWTQSVDAVIRGLITAQWGDESHRKKRFCWIFLDYCIHFHGLFKAQHHSLTSLTTAWQLHVFILKMSLQLSCRQSTNLSNMLLERHLQLQFAVTAAWKLHENCLILQSEQQQNCKNLHSLRHWKAVCRFNCIICCSSCIRTA